MNQHLKLAYNHGAQQAQQDHGVSAQAGFESGVSQAYNDFGLTKTAISDELKYRAAWEARLRRNALKEMADHMDRNNLLVTAAGEAPDGTIRPGSTREELGEAMNRRLRQEMTFRGVDPWENEFPGLRRSPNASAAAARELEQSFLGDTGIMDDYRANHSMPLQGQGGDVVQQQRYREEAAAIQAEQAAAEAAEAARRPTRIPSLMDRLTETSKGRRGLIAGGLGLGALGLGAYGLRDDD